MKCTPTEFSRMKLIEELGELIQVVAKLQAFPTEGQHPDGQGHLYERIGHEIADVEAAVKYFKQHHFIEALFSDDEIAARVAVKLEKFCQYGEEKT